MTAGDIFDTVVSPLQTEVEKVKQTLQWAKDDHKEYATKADSMSIFVERQGHLGASKETLARISSELEQTEKAS